MSPSGEPRTLAGRYQLEDVIGRGGMSTVYRATDLSLDRTVAVKVALDPLVERDPIYVARFTREARAAASINHPGAVTVYDAGADGSTLYIVMEYVKGRSLDRILRDEHPLAPARAAQIARQVADALSVAHGAGIIHRDIKPGNVMIADTGAVKVLDFGIARALDNQTLTRTAVVLGTAPYMSPEQALGQPADARSDIYSLGCLLYEMLVGKPPFMAEVPAAVMNQHVNAAVTPPSELNPKVPPALDALVVQMLAKSPDDRPQTAAEVRDRLDRALTEPEDAGGPADAAIAAAATAATVPLIGMVPEGASVPEDATAAAAPQRAPVPEEASSATVPQPAAVPRAPRKEAPAPGGRTRRGLWTALVAVVALLLGGAVALALTAGGSGHSTSTTTGHGSSSATGSHTSSQITSTRAPTSTTTSTKTITTSTSPTSSGSTSTSTPTSTTSGTSSSTAPLTTTTAGALGTPSGQGAVAPGKAKKAKKNKT